jgi:hypothetical protein
MGGRPALPAEEVGADAVVGQPMTLFKGLLVHGLAKRVRQEARPPQTPSQPRPVEPHRIRSNHEHASQADYDCHLPVRQTRPVSAIRCRGGRGPRNGCSEGRRSWMRWLSRSRHHCTGSTSGPCATPSRS